MRDLGPKKEPDPPRPGRNFDVDLQLHYLSPGAFTVLPSEYVPPADPPQAPVPYRLTPSTRRNRNQAFSIIAEPNSRNTSRSPSPTGRVSPFRGRGFNPVGSRHASPAPSPPPELATGASKPPVSPNKISKIPKIRRRNSSVLFGEKVSHSEASSDSSPAKGGLTSQLSQSMTNISPTKVSNKPPPSPQKGYVKNPAFRQLSPIIGSSPEPSQSQSSPSRIPTKSRSQPQSRLPSPSRLTTSTRIPTSKPPSRNASRNPSRSTSRVQSRNTSREASPSTKPSISPSKAKYQNVQPKVNSFSKPKVPPKPTLTSDSELSDRPTTKTPRYKKQTMNRVKNSVNKIGASSTINNRSNGNKTSNSNVNNKNDSKPQNISDSNENNNNSSNILNGVTYNSASETDFTDIDKKTTNKKNNNTKNRKKNGNNSSSTNKTKGTDDNSNLSDTTSGFTTDPEQFKKNDSSIRLFDLLNYTSAANIVPTTTATVTKPLKIDANIELAKSDLPKGISPMVDGRVLSATSVSHAINKMNDTVLDTKTIMRESGLSKLSPAANAIISMSRENNNNASADMQKSGISNSDEMSTKNGSSGVKGSSTLNANSSNNNALSTNSNALGTNNNAIGTNTNNNVLNTTSNSLRPNNNVIGNVNNNAEAHKRTNASEPTSNHVTSTGLMDAKTLEMHVQNNMSKLIAAENTFGNSVQKSVNDRIHESRTVFAADVKPVQPIQILVKEKPSDQDVESGNVRLPVSATNGSIHGRPSLPPDHPPTNKDQKSNQKETPEDENKGNSRAAKLLASAKNKLLCKSCRKAKKEEIVNVASNQVDEQNESKKGCFSCLKKKEQLKHSIKISVEEDGKEVKPGCWNRLKCCGNNNTGGEQQGCLPCGKRKPNWEERRDSILSDLPRRPTCAMRCKRFMKKLFCLHLCKKKRKFQDLSVSRRASMLSKKKSLTPTSQPIEDHTPKLDLSLVEHTSHMKAAIPVLPIPLAWFCLIMNCILPGTGTVLSGLFCLCFGKPRFSQKDGIRSRIGAFIIDCIVGFSQCFTILFCLVGWGWSIWWGVIMVKIARKYKKIKFLADAEEPVGKRSSVINRTTQFRDPERGT